MCAGHGLCAFSSLINLSAWALKDSAPLSDSASLGSYLGSLLQSASRNVLLGFVCSLWVYQGSRQPVLASCTAVVCCRLVPATSLLACMHAICDHATCSLGVVELMLWFFACSPCSSCLFSYGALAVGLQAAFVRRRTQCMAHGVQLRCQLAGMIVCLGPFFVDMCVRLVSALLCVPAPSHTAAGTQALQHEQRGVPSVIPV